LIFVAAVDCTGHGVPGAFMSIMGSNLLHFAVRELQLDDPGKILDRMSFELKKRITSKPNDLEDQYGMDMALCVINTETKELKYAGAFNPLVIVSENSFDLLEADRFPLGRSFYNTGDKNFSTQTKSLGEKDHIYLFSDGYKDQFGGANAEKYSSTKFNQLLQKASKLSIEEQKIFIEDELLQWKNDHEQIDDILVIGLEV
jgi:serine phosphatase RsbU (regulator of sigma subunit)